MCATGMGMEREAMEGAFRGGRETVGSDVIGREHMQGKETLNNYVRQGERSVGRDSEGD